MTSVDVLNDCVRRIASSAFDQGLEKSVIARKDRSPEPRVLFIAKSCSMPGASATRSASAPTNVSRLEGCKSVSIVTKAEGEVWLFVLYQRVESCSISTCRPRQKGRLTPSPAYATVKEPLRSAVLSKYRVPLTQGSVSERCWIDRGDQLQLKTLAPAGNPGVMPPMLISHRFPSGETSR
jgi:hypothetical protein